MIRILLAHTAREICEKIRTTLDKEDGLYVVGCATTADELRFLLPHGNVVLLGPELEDASAFDLITEMQMTHPHVKVLVLGVDKQPEDILRYTEAGAAGYILQNESAENILVKLQAAQEEKAIVSPAIAAAMIDRLSDLANEGTHAVLLESQQTQLDELTNREREVLDLIGHGYTNQEIADKLIIQCGTVKNHVHNILRKLDVNNRHEAASILHNAQPSLLAAAD